MKKINFGLKLWSTNTTLIGKAQELIENDYFDYIELTYIPKSNIDPFLDKEIEYLIHLPTDRHGVNIGNLDDFQENLEIVKKGLKWADQLNARYAILHPGYGNLQDVMTFLNEIEDERILIENMPVKGLNRESMLGYSRKELSKLKNEKFGFCLDLNHAIKAAISLNKDYKEFIREFMKLEPQMFHMADGKLNFERDEHLHIGEGAYDWDFLIDIIKNSNSKYVTLETPRETLDDDIKNLKKIKE